MNDPKRGMNVSRIGAAWLAGILVILAGEASRARPPVSREAGVVDALRMTSSTQHSSSARLKAASA